MLGPYPMAVLRMDRTARQPTELARYVRWEYGPQAEVAAFLAQAAEDLAKARTKRPGRIVEGIRAIANALRSVTTVRGSKAEKTEG